jgi:hypothetical protein
MFTKTSTTGAIWPWLVASNSGSSASEKLDATPAPSSLVTIYSSKEAISTGDDHDNLVIYIAKKNR